MVDFQRAADRLKLIRVAKEKNVWDPTILAPAFYDPMRDGVTFSLMSGWRQCRELARLNLHGVTSRGTGLALVYGTLVHSALQFVYEAARRSMVQGVPSQEFVAKTLDGIDAIFKKENPRASADTLQYAEFSMLLANATLPFYFNYWKTDFSTTRWRALEGEFRIPYQAKLYDGRVIPTFIRGKMDGCFDEHGKLKLFETKTKSRIDEGTIADILPHELQVMIYLWAMRRIYKQMPSGVRYNIIRRPALRQKVSESYAQFAIRCAADIKSRPDFYFLRMDMDITRADMARFEGEFDDLVRDFLSWWYGVSGHYKNSGNCVNNYGTCAMLPICGPDKNYAMFYTRNTVFRELEEK